MFKADPSELNFLDQFLLLDIGKNIVKSKKFYCQQIIGQKKARFKNDRA